MKILLAVDGSSFTKRMLAYLTVHEDWLGAQHQYTAVYAAPAVPPRAAAVLDKDVLRAHYDDEVEKVFKPIRQFFARRGIEATYIGKVGHAADTIVAVAKKGDYDLLMMGSHGQSSLAGLVMGSVATKVLAGCSTPVLLVR
jgi:nucleotide-binding universal stress UspA family protein